MNHILSNPVAWIALVVSFVSAAVTIWKIRRDLARQNSQDYLTAATRLLEQAYGSFDKARDEKWLGLPQPSRLLWLTVARMIQESAITAKHITETSHKVLYEHARNFWRGQLHDLLLPLERISLRYFAEDADSLFAVTGNKRMPLSGKSLRIILAFLEWPAEKKDPLDEAERFTELDRIRLVGYEPVVAFLEAEKTMCTPNECTRRHWRKRWHQADP